jgi:hypothetical protein
VALSKPSTRFNLLTETGVPSEPLAADVVDNQGRLIVKAGEPLTQSLIDRLRKMGILEIFITNKEAKGPDYWDRWGQEWFKEVVDRLVLLDPEGGICDESVLRFKRILSEAILEFVQQKGIKPEN